jgi:hypothetical protein
MGDPLKLLVVSDIHYAGPREQCRHGYEERIATHPLQAAFIRLYRNNIWLRDPLGHNHFLDWLFELCGEPDLVVANGDYSCDSGFVGLADDAALESAEICLRRLRQRFGRRLHLTLGDHELGKKSLVGGVGGLRLESFHRCRERLGLKPFWRIERGAHVLIGVTSTLLALDAMLPESLPGEHEQWRDLASQHRREIAGAFERLRQGQRVILFCHDPTALPFLARIPTVRANWGRIAQTVLGHLHSNFIFNTAHRLAGIPAVNFAGVTLRRITNALRRAREWEPFKPVLCPSPTGIEALRDGGFLTVELPEDGSKPLDWRLHPIPWTGPEPV